MPKKAKKKKFSGLFLV